jgi:hypothetical protein
MGERVRVSASKRAHRRRVDARQRRQVSTDFVGQVDPVQKSFIRRTSASKRGLPHNSRADLRRAFRPPQRQVQPL